MPPALTPAERQKLKGLAHRLHPIILIGDNGLSEAVLREIDASLKAHELIKIRVFGDDRRLRDEILGAICARLDAAPVQHIGKVLVVYRPNPEPAPGTAAQRPATPIAARRRARTGARTAPPARRPARSR